MKLIELLSACSESTGMDIQVMISGEGIISNAAMLEGYLCKDALNMHVSDIAIEDENTLKVWVNCDG